MMMTGVLLITISVLLIAVLFLGGWLKRKKDLLKRKEAELRELQNTVEKMHQERNALISMIVHDFRNPIIGIVTLTDAVKEEFDSSEVQEILDLIQEGAKQADSLIQDLAAMRKTEKELADFEQEIFSPADLIREIVATFEEKSQHNQVRLQVVAESFQVESSRSFLSQIIKHLVSNALVVSPEGHEVRIFARAKEDDLWELIVEDEGPGFGGKDVSRLFQMLPGFSSGSSGEHFPQKTGFGLYLIKQLIERLKGTIRLDESYKDGARFICTLPVSCPDGNSEVF